MEAAKLAKISADSHVDEPHDLWYERMDRDERDRAPRRIRAERRRRLDARRRRQPHRMGQPVGRGGPGQRTVAGSCGSTRGAPRDAAQRLRERRDHLPDHRPLRLERRGSRGRASIVHGLQRLGARAPRRHRAHPDRRDDPDVGPRPWRSTRSSAWRPTIRSAACCSRSSAPRSGTRRNGSRCGACSQETGKPVVMHQGTGHDMIFYRGWGSATTNLLTTQSMAPPRRRAPELRWRARPPSRSARRDRRGQRGVDGVDDVDARRVLPRAPRHRLDRSRSCPSCRASTSVARCTPRSRTTRSRSTTSR